MSRTAVPSRFGLHPTVLVLAATHFIIDGYGNIFAPLLPLLIVQLDLSLAASGTLQMCFQLANSVAQLGFGPLADRWRPRVLLIGGPLLGVVLLPLIGLADNVWTLGLVLVAGGLGIAAFHPPAAVLVHQSGDAGKGLAMSFHITSGTLGQAIAPLAFAPFVERFGLRATPLLMLPALAVLIGGLLRRIPPIATLHAADDARGVRALRPYARPLGLLYGIVVLRTLTASSFGFYVPVLLTERGLSLAEAGVASSLYMFAVGAGGFLGGPGADRFGARRVIVLSLVLSVPLLAVAPTLSGWTFVAILAAGGFLLQSTLPVNVTFAQMIAPVSAATVSSLMMGFAWGTGGLLAPFVGMLADRIGIERMLTMMAFLPLVGAALAMALPARVHGIPPASARPGVSSSTGTDVAE
jgi:FSR family fosmidomycin resistance protein-like MFS transporter